MLSHHFSQFRLTSLEVSKVKLSPFSRGRPKGSLFNCYYTEVPGRALLLSLDCFILLLIRSLYCWVLSKEVSNTIFEVFGMTWPGIEPRSPRPLANTLPIRPMSRWLVSVLKQRKVKVSNVGDCSRRRPEGSLFNCYYTEV